MCQTHAPTFNKWHQKKKTLHMLTQGAMRGCELTSWVVCITDKSRDIRERNVTIRSEIGTTNIRSLGFRDTRECVTLWGLILWSLGCVRVLTNYAQKSPRTLIHTVCFIFVSKAPCCCSWCCCHLHNTTATELQKQNVSIPESTCCKLNALYFIRVSLTSSAHWYEWRRGRRSHASLDS
jgi:hypothetical protein